MSCSSCHFGFVARLSELGKINEHQYVARITQQDGCQDIHILHKRGNWSGALLAPVLWASSMSRPSMLFRRGKLLISLGVGFLSRPLVLPACPVGWGSEKDQLAVVIPDLFAISIIQKKKKKPREREREKRRGWVSYLAQARTTSFRYVQAVDSSNNLHPKVLHTRSGLFLKIIFFKIWFP